MVETTRATRAREARETRRRQLLEVALEVFSAKGYYEASITDVVSAAGVARGTFYQYFDSKEAIFHELLDDLVLGLQQSVVGVDMSPGALPVREQLVGTVVRILDAVDQNRRFVHIVLRVAVGLDDAVDQKLDHFFGALHRLLHESLDRGQALGLIRACDTELAAHCVLGSFRAVVEHYLGGDAPADTRGLAEGLVSFSFRGLLA